MNLKKVEDAYLAKLGYGAPSPINKDGTPGINPYSTLPEFGANSRDVSMFYIGDKDAIVNNKARGVPGMVSTDQRYALHKQEILRKLRGEDKFLRNMEHQILNTKLTIDRKRLDIKSLQDEQTAVQGTGS